MKTKKEFKYFTIVEHEKEQEYLRRRGKEGWKFTKVSGLGIYHFEENKPEDIVYQLDYNQEGLSHKDEYIRMFEDCGWEYIQDYAGYSYFRKPAAEMNGNEEIFCDDESRLQMMQRVFKGRMIPLFVMFSLVIIPQLLLSIFSTHNYALAAVYGAITVLYVTIFVAFAVKYKKYKDKVK